MKTKLLYLLIVTTLWLASCQTEEVAAPTSAPTDTPPATATSAPTRAATPTATAIPTSTPIATPVPIPANAEEGWELVWSDEFEGDSIDPDNWTYEIGGWGWGNGEAQYYTSRPENARVENGMLVIEARQEKYEDSYYTSARLITQDLREFQYGRIEARIKVPEGDGLWPAFWMLGSDFERNPDQPLDSNWPHVGEVDIMEHVGREPDLIMGTVHGPGYSGAGGLGRWNRQEYDIADEFHTYAIEWDETGITWFYDGEPYYTLTPDDLNDREWVFDKEFFLLLNLAIGGQFGGTIGLDTKFPTNLYVDYVRVYQRTQ
ncbi:MAG: glycoside hydrolase family 16 protein [Candidatus Promineifilaceae bacterium]|nr:glycoside hydrolase family 16 protein [Candidatus Promineifilaceae bacterium]